MSKEQIDGATLAVLNCYRNKYYAEGNNTEQGVVANAINDVLPILVELKEDGYRKQSEGEWVKVMNHRECSNCGYNAPYKKIKAGYHLQDLTKYCPNCGAKMKGCE